MEQKKLSKIVLYCLGLIAFSGCFKDYEERYLFTDNRVEFEDAVVNDAATGKSFPILGPLTQDAGIVKYRVNMTGEQSDEDRTVDFRVVSDETTAREGVDYQLPRGETFVIPANSSFGWVELEVLPKGSGSPIIVFELLETGDIAVMDRYHQIGIRIEFPLTSPDPDEVEEINDIRYFKNITFGAQLNQNIGNFVDAHTGDAYIVSGADESPENIDFILQRSTSTEVNLLTPSSSALTIWNSSSHIPDEWPVHNDGELVRIASPTGIELDQYEAVASQADLLALYNTLVTDIEDRPGYSSYHGPGTRIREVDAGDLILFKSNDRDVIAILKVDEMVTGYTGHIKGEMKSGGAG